MIDATWSQYVPTIVSLCGVAFVVLKGAALHGAVVQRVDELEHKVNTVHETLEQTPRLAEKVSNLAEALEGRKATIDLIPVLVERIANLQRQSLNQANDLKHEIKNMRAVVDSVARKQ